MSRINTNIQSLVAARVMAQNNEALNVSLERLATGYRINKGKDDPAGLIASESLRTEMKDLTAAIDNASRADKMVAVAEGGLGEVNSLLLELEDLVDRTANEAALNEDEVKANQMQIDSILNSITRIATTTTFKGNKLLDGTYDYTTSGAGSSNVAALQVNAARLPDNGTRNVVVDVTNSAETGKLTFTGAGLAAANDVTIQVQGQYGTEVFSFAGSTAIADIVTAVNQAKELTGVSAVVSGAGGMHFNSTDYGSDAFVSVQTLSGSFTVTGGTGGKDYGADVEATINGVAANTDGLQASINTAALNIDLTLTASFAQQTATTESFVITGGGAKFSIGPDISLAGQESLGIKSVAAGSLGDTNVGFISSLASGQANQLSAKNFATGQRVIREAINQVSTLRGRLGAFQKDTLQPAIKSMQVAFENTSAAESAIRDTDFASETAQLTRSQILVNAATSVLQTANASPSAVLSLMG